MTDPTPTPLLDLPLPRGESHLTRAARYLRPRWKRITAMAAVAAGALTVGGHLMGGVAGMWEFYRTFVSGHEKPAASVLAAQVPPFRSIAFVPLAVAPDSAEDQQLAKSVVADLTAATRRAYADMVVVSNASAQQAAATTDPKKIGRELGVRYVAGGTLRRSAGGVELELELIDTLDGRQLWSERVFLDRNNSAQTLARLRVAMKGTVSDSTQRELHALPPNQQQAWQLVMRASNIGPAIEDQPEAQRLLEAALRLDPDFPIAMRMLNIVLFQRIQDEPQRRDELLRPMEDLSARGVRAMPNDARVWRARASTLRLERNWNGAFAANEEALRLDPFDPGTLEQHGALLLYNGHPEQSLEWFARARAISPASGADVWECLAYMNLARDGDAVPLCERGVLLWDRWIMHGLVAGAHANAGNLDKARRWKDRMMASNPRASLSLVRAVIDLNSDHPAFRAQGERWIEGLRKAGLPE